MCEGWYCHNITTASLVCRKQYTPKDKQRCATLMHASTSDLHPPPRSSMAAAAGLMTAVVRSRSSSTFAASVNRLIACSTWKAPALTLLGTLWHSRRNRGSWRLTDAPCSATDSWGSRCCSSERISCSLPCWIMALGTKSK